MHSISLVLSFIKINQVLVISIHAFRILSELDFWQNVWVFLRGNEEFLSLE